MILSLDKSYISPQSGSFSLHLILPGLIVTHSPVWGGGAVHVVIPVAHSEFLVEARLVAAHVGNPATILITHVKYLEKEKLELLTRLSFGDI